MRLFFIYSSVMMSAFFWGSNFNVASIVVQNIDPIFAASERFILASIFIILYCLILRVNLTSVTVSDFFFMAILGLIGITGLNIFFFLGIKYTSPMNGALIMSTTPITTYVLNVIFYESYITRQKILGLLISFIGVSFVIFHGDISNVIDFKLNKGDVFIVVSNLCMAIYTIGCKNWIQKAKSIQVTSFSLVFGTLGILVFLIFHGFKFSDIYSVSALEHELLIYMALAGSVLAYLFWNFGIRAIGPSNTSVFFNFVPIFTMVISYCQGEKTNNYQFLGIVFVIIGVLITTQSITTKSITTQRALFFRVRS